MAGNGTHKTYNMVKLIFFPILLSLLFSGFSSLGFQIIWVRLISLFFGHTSLAVSTVLAVFMSGLALGSFICSKRLKKLSTSSILKIYVLLQVTIALYGLLSKPLIYFVNNAAADLGIIKTVVPLQFFIWFIAAFIILIIPTTVMGMTFPLIVEWVSRKDCFTKHVGLLYAVNTFGAVSGVILYGFFIIYSFGLNNGIMFASLFYLLSALLAYLCIFIKPGNTKTQEAPCPIEQKNEFSNHGLAVLISAGICGFAGMACEIVWTRTYISIIGSSTYAFSIVLATFLTGISLGSLSFKTITKEITPSFFNYSILIILLAGSVLISFSMFNYIPYLFIKLQQITHNRASYDFAVKFILCALTMLPPTFIMGLTFPWAVKIIDDLRNSTGETTAICYGFNTLGSVAGSFAAGFLYLPAIGAENTLLSIIVIYLLLGFYMLYISARLKIIQLAVSFAAAVSLIIIAPGWDPFIISSGVFLYGNVYKDIHSYKDFKEFLREDNLLFYKDGISATVSVFDHKYQDRYLRINGKTDASYPQDMPTQLLVGYIPVLFSSAAPEKTMVIGLGSGVTLSALAAFDFIKEIDCIEIEPAVKEAAGYFFKINKNVLKDPRLNIIFADARNYFYSNKKKYDIIISEPSNPWIAGISSLYSREAFELGKSNLTEKGIYAQWIHSYSMSEKDFKAVLATFASVFPYTALFCPKGMDFVLIGSGEEIKIDAGKINKLQLGNSRFISDLNFLRYIHPLPMIERTLILNNEELREYLKGSDILTDNYPVLEFSAPLNFNSDGIDICEHIFAANKRRQNK